MYLRLTGQIRKKFMHQRQMGRDFHFCPWSMTGRGNCPPDANSYKSWYDCFQTSNPGCDPRKRNKFSTRSDCPACCLEAVFKPQHRGRELNRAQRSCWRDRDQSSGRPQTGRIYWEKYQRGGSDKKRELWKLPRRLCWNSSSYAEGQIPQDWGKNHKNTVGW